MQPGIVYGLNGSGKSVLLKCLCGLMEPDSGSVTFNGRRISGNNVDQFNFGVSIEKPDLIDDISGYENIRYLASFRNKASAKMIRQWFEYFNLAEDRNKPVRDYSLGMRQKLMLIQALMEKPDVILLDEVTNSLDQKSRKPLFHVLNQKKAAGKIILLVDHDIQEIHAVSDAVFTIDEGRVEPWHVL